MLEYYLKCRPGYPARAERGVGGYTPLAGDDAMKFLYAAILFFSLAGAAAADSFEQALVAAALERTAHSVRYDGSYFAIAYPGGDVPADVGVCTDVVIRAYRATGVDLQQLVHEDMSDNFWLYPSERTWGLQKPDSNIDHRRVPNLQVFFQRHGMELPISDRADAFLPGDIVTWTLPGNLPHIGIVSDRVDPASGRRMIVHNIGAGPKLEDMLFDYPVAGHYRYFPER